MPVWPGRSGLAQGASGAWGVTLKRRRASRSCFLTVQTIGRSKPICNRWLARAALERPRPPRTAGNSSRTAARLPGGRVGSRKQQRNAGGCTHRREHSLGPHCWRRCGLRTPADEHRSPHEFLQHLAGCFTRYRLAALPPGVTAWRTPAACNAARHGFGVSCSVCKRRRIRAAPPCRASGCILLRVTVRASGASTSPATGAWCSASRTARPWTWTSQGHVAIEPRRQPGRRA